MSAQPIEADLKPVLIQLVHAEGLHHFTKADGTWACPCGATADRYGKVSQ